MITSQQYRVAEIIALSFADMKRFFKQDEIILSSPSYGLVVNVSMDVVRFFFGGYEVELDASDWDARATDAIPVGSLDVKVWFGKFGLLPSFVSGFFARLVSACVNAVATIEEDGVAVKVSVGTLDDDDDDLIEVDEAIVRK